jgi:hypothetical protein
MSLILEALKKIEREKQAPERGVVVLASVARAGEPQRGSRGAWVAVAVALVCAVAGAGLLRRPRAEAPLPAVTQAPATARRTLDAAPPPIALAPVAPAVKPARAMAPVASTAPPAVAPAPLRLSAIGSRDGVPVAVINDEIVQVGDVVNGATVVSIGTGSVEVEVDGQRRQVSF